MLDATLDRTTDGQGPIIEKSDSYLSGLDAGSWFGPEFDGVPMPTLGDAFNAADGEGVLYLDLKQQCYGMLITIKFL